jgi:hypothetical protein
MKQTISANQFVDAFQSLRPDNFSYEGLQALYNYLEEYRWRRIDRGRLDVIALCCDFTEWENLKVMQNNYSSGSETMETMEDIEDDTTTIYIPDSDRFITQEF